MRWFLAFGPICRYYFGLDAGALRECAFSKQPAWIYACFLRMLWILCLRYVNSSFKSGFRDKRRIEKDPTYHGFLYKGALAGFLAALPLFGLYLSYRITSAGVLGLYYMLANMYWTWPMINIYPNHQPLVMVLAFVPMLIIPWIGYIAGYKNFILADLAVKIYNKFVRK